MRGWATTVGCSSCLLSRRDFPHGLALQEAGSWCRLTFSGNIPRFYPWRSWSCSLYNWPPLWTCFHFADLSSEPYNLTFVTGIHSTVLVPWFDGSILWLSSDVCVPAADIHRASGHVRPVTCLRILAACLASPGLWDQSAARCRFCSEKHETAQDIVGMERQQTVK